MVPVCCIAVFVMVLGRLPMGNVAWWEAVCMAVLALASALLWRVDVVARRRAMVEARHAERRAEWEHDLIVPR